MVSTQVPLEVSGYRSVEIYVVDDLNQIEGFRWYSVANDTQSADDFEIWQEDDCPF